MSGILAGMKGQRRLRLAGDLLMAIGAVQVGGGLYLCWAGMDGDISPLTVVMMGWPVAALFMYLGGRLRSVEI